MKIDSPTFVSETKFISASVVYSSGSQKFGNTEDDQHTFVGSITASGNFELTGANKKISGSSTSTGSFGSLYSGKDIYVGGPGDIGTATTSHMVKMGTTNRSWGMKATTSPDVLGIGEVGYATMAMNFGTGQKVGIGTTTLTYPGLTINTGGADGGLAIVTTGGYDNKIYFGDAGDDNIGAISYDHGNNDIYFTVNTAAHSRMHS